MKTAYILPNIIGTGGIAKVIFAKIDYLIENFNYDITIITYMNIEKKSAYTINKNVKFIHLNLDSNKNLKSVLSNVLKENKFDIVISSLSNNEFYFINSIKDGSKKIAEFHTCFDYIKGFTSKRENFLKYIKEKISFYKFILAAKKFNAFVVKPDNSHGSRGLRILDLDYDAKKYYNTKDPYFCSLDEILRILRTDEHLLIQPFYSGQTYNVDCYKLDDQLIMVAQKVLGNRWGQVLGSEIIIKGDPEYDEIFEWATDIQRTMGLNKNFNFEVGYSSITGKLELVEVNPRISAVFPQSIHTKHNLVLISLYDALGMKDELDAIINSDLEKVFLQSALITKVEY